MKINQPILSICIPTYNRAETLDKCIKSITDNDNFTNNIEIIISDNSTDDATMNVANKYANKYPNICYYKNESNVGGERNFILALKRGTGLFLKLHNDYSCFTETGLKTLVSIIEKYKEQKPVLFFRNRKKSALKFWKKSIGEIEYKSFDKFVETVGWGMSWIGAYGFWNEDFNSWPDPEKRIDTQFMQVDWLIRCYKKRHRIMLCNYYLTYRIPINGKQGDYNFFKVHTVNYFLQFQECVDEGLLSQHAFLTLKRKVFRGLIPWIYKLNIKKDNRYSYSSDGSIQLLWKEYKKYPWTYIEIIRYIIRKIAKLLLIK